MEYTIGQITGERELDAALALDERVFGISSGRKNPAYSRERWLERLAAHPELMLCAKVGGELAGIAFGRLEGDGSVTIGPVAVDARHRGRGLARRMMLLLEERAAGQGARHLNLGSVESAEGFYRKLGYTGVLLVQSESHSVEELLSLSTDYPVVGTNVYDGSVNQIYLSLPAPDRELQRRYEAAFEGCYTQMVFTKTLEEGNRDEG